LVKVRFFKNRRRPRADRDDAVGITRHHLRHALDQIRRVQPRLAQFIQPPRRRSDLNRARVVGMPGRGEVSGQPFREGEGLEN
jgi:hypothetical protein